MKRKDDLELLDEEEEEDLDDEELDDAELDEIAEYEPSSGFRGFLVGVAIGALVGAGVALLVAPDRGSTMRQRIGRGLRDFQEDARDHLDDWRGDARREVRKQRRRLQRKIRRDRSR